MYRSKWIKFGLAVFKEIALISAAAIVAIFVLKLSGYFQTQPNADGSVGTSHAPLVTDAQLIIKAADFTAHPLSLILVTSPTCQYCLASKAFHQKLQTEAQLNDVPLYVAVPSSGNAAAYVRDVRFAPESIREWKDLNLAASGTPTLVAVDQKGTVRRLWVGQLPPERESTVFSLIKARSISDSESPVANKLQVPNYSSQDIAKLKTRGKLTIVDTHERGFPRVRQDAVVIPIAELPFRAPNELDAHKLQLVDCSSLTASLCQRSVEMLKSAGFHVATLDAGTYEEYCRAASIQ